MDTNTDTNFLTHPAFNWSAVNTTWNKDEREMFSCYTNSFRLSSGDFSQPMDFMAHWFKQSYLGGNW